ncbi:MAG: DNA-3-methyladenine glycosylase [Chitinophagaceae bacterium]
MPILESSFYTKPSAVSIAKSLLGKYLFTHFNNCLTGGIIVETEAYCGESDRASHAYGGRKTSRTQVMYGQGGHAYVYLCYGIHHLFNVVTNQAGIPHAVLIRALEPMVGLDHMMARRNKTSPDFSLCSGPGTLSSALGIHSSHSGMNLQGPRIWIEDRGVTLRKKDWVVGSRVGVDYAGKDAALPYRFSLRDNPWVSRARGYREERVRIKP